MSHEHYYQEISPYKMIFGVIEDIAQTTDLRPTQAYAVYDQMLTERYLDPTVYLSMAITSGGFKRDSSLGIGDVISLNTEYGSLAASTLVGEYPDFQLGDIIVPSELGKVKGWSQADYLLFWSHVITGVDVDTAQKIETELTEIGSLTTPGFTDPAADQFVKQRDYGGFAMSYAKTLREIASEAKQAGTWQPPHNMQAVVFILDQDMSHGAQAEELLAREIGIPPQHLQEVQKETFTTAQPRFKELVERLSVLGAEALGSIIIDYKAQFSKHPTIKANYNVLSELGMRETGVRAAEETAQYYRELPFSRPNRHTGHTPLHDRPSIDFTDAQSETLQLV